MLVVAVVVIVGWLVPLHQLPKMETGEAPGTSGAPRATAELNAAASTKAGVVDYGLVWLVNAY